MIGHEQVPRRFGRLYFTRATGLWGDGPLWHRMRALKDGMRVDAVVVDDIPLEVDTPAELERARATYRQAGSGA